MISFDKHPDILVVDDNLENLKLLIALLDERGYLARPVTNGELALRAIQASPPDLILLDINMPEMNGYDLCEKLKDDLVTRNIPVVFLSAYQDIPKKLNAFQAGGVDYITKPFVAEEVFARIENHLAIAMLQNQLRKQNLRLRTEIEYRDKSELGFRKLAQAVIYSGGSMMITDLEGKIEFVNAAFSANTGYAVDEIIGQTPRILKSGKTESHTYDILWETIQKGAIWRGELLNRRKNGELYWERTVISSITNEDGQVTHYVAIYDDITNLKEKEQHLARLAFHDVLTGLPNKALFNQNVQHALALAKRNDWQVAIFFVDLNHFKMINDRFGHATGDNVLLEFGKRLQKSLRESDTVARLSGDEFAVLVENISTIKHLLVLIEKIIENLEKPFRIGEKGNVHLTASIGISIFPQDGEECAVLLEHADQAMYKAKKTREKSTYRLYESIVPNHEKTKDKL